MSAEAKVSVERAAHRQLLKPFSPQPKAKAPSRGTLRLRRAIEVKLNELRLAWEKADSNPSRTAIYEYLAAVSNVGSNYIVRNQEEFVIRYVMTLAEVKQRKNHNVYCALIKATSDASNKNVSKWSRLLSCACASGFGGHELPKLLKEMGGMNAVLTEWGRRKGASTQISPVYDHDSLDDDWGHHEDNGEHSEEDDEEDAELSDYLAYPAPLPEAVIRIGAEVLRTELEKSIREKVLDHRMIAEKIYRTMRSS